MRGLHPRPEDFYTDRGLESGKASRRAAVECQAFFNFFTPKPAAAAPIVDPRAKPLVERLIALTRGTDAGAKASPALKEEIADVITELSRYCVKNPLKSDLLFGEWKVLFSSKASAVGGPPLRSGVGPAVFPAQDAKQILEAPNKLINSVEYKTLGFLPGFSRQYATFEPISADTYLLNITDGEISAGLGGPIKKTFDIQRKIKILYLDDKVRVAQFLPDDSLPDTEADENGGRSGEDVVFVFQRITEEAEAEEEDGQADDGEGAEEAPKPAPFFGGSRKLESAATVAERQVRQQLKEQRGGSAKVAASAAAVPAKAPLGSARVVVPPAPRQVSQRGRREVAEEVVEDPRERRRREQEEERARKAAEAEAKAAEAKAARERAEAERQAEREKQAAIKELLAKLANEIKERQAEAKEALKELKDVEKSTASGLKESQGARSRLEEAESDVKSISTQLDAASATKKEAEKAAKDAKEVVVAAEKTLRARIAAAAPVLARK
ncbi:hypothetical protein VOLCADRAFT_106656 [Volvox carteri f. nagariensis]|uniref:Plastid lipid-associated protein/fibrillin conserved domain-containing protein n=1 Tax=Volvox carteri f. nagariensis TaxID=3068 RepID=D8U8X6_VOLCA|nr:uncharacterized protein VOLCADRAFT_106656 [Volvox carteri f. nagariensis]EFJ43883.1 hypothetical protein VOLCADRAFT_106656 [Volvox carteri f. nagariensis]|eukprot:XP_002955129.1 hypothetical protein VOLCADRAFT_106656 [Volvox carteri f. nagariensis]